MSTFQGFIDEIPGICIDNFARHTFTASAFFLSHVHFDHMNGLNRKCRVFLERLIDDEIYIYSSEVSTKMLQVWYPLFREKFKYIPLGTEVPIFIPSTKKNINVTTFPAGHCPGSVMFLFENEKTILYTGDIRISLNQIQKYQILSDCKIDKMHLDTTFLHEDYENFPSRDESLEEICKLIAEWIEHSELHVVHIKPSAVYGGEFVINEIYKRFKIPICVSDDMYEVLKYFPDMDKAITRNLTQIHSNFFETNAVGFIRTIHTTAWRWRNWKVGDPIVRKENSMKFYVCYSSHSSYRELREFINFLKPNEVEANVVNSNECVSTNMYKLLGDCVNKYKNKIAPAVVKNNFDINLSFKEEENLEEDLCEVDYGDLLDSPPRMDFKKRRF